MPTAGLANRLDPRDGMTSRMTDGPLNSTTPSRPPVVQRAHHISASFKSIPNDLDNALASSHQIVPCPSLSRPRRLARSGDRRMRQAILRSRGQRGYA